MLALAACTSQTPAGAPAPKAVPEAREESPELAALPPPSKPPDERSAPEALGDPSRLIGADRVALQRLVGAPDLKRQEGTAELWQYQGKSCVMDAYLYPSAEDAGAPHVSYVEMRQGGLTVISAPEAVARCYAEVVAKGKHNAAVGALGP